MVPMNFLLLSSLQLNWQEHLLHFMVGRIGELRGMIKELWDKHPQGFYA